MTDRPKTLDDCKVPLCPNCGWPEVDFSVWEDGAGIAGKYNVLSLIGLIITKIHEQTDINVVIGFDNGGELQVWVGKKP